MPIWRSTWYRPASAALSSSIVLTRGTYTCLEVLSPDRDLLEGLPTNVGDFRVSRRVAYGQHEHGSFVRRPLQHLAEKAHRRRRVRECREPHVMHRRDEQSGGDPTRFLSVVVGSLSTVGSQSVDLP